MMSYVTTLFWQRVYSLRRSFGGYPKVFTHFHHLIYETGIRFYCWFNAGSIIQDYADTVINEESNSIKMETNNNTFNCTSYANTPVPVMSMAERTLLSNSSK